MNKTEYFSALKAELKGIPASEIEEIVRDQQEYITEALRAGRAETDVIESLGSPTDFAKEIKASQQVRAAATETKLISKTDKVFRAILALCVLAPFNFLVLLGPFIALCCILLSFWLVAVIGFGASLAIFISSFFALSKGAALFVGVFFGGISGIGFGLLGLIACYYLTLWSLRGTAWYLNKNFEIVKGAVRA